MYQSPLRTFRGHSLYDQHLNLAPTNKAKFAQNAKEEMFLIQILGKPVPTIIDEFLEKFQTAFDPPPPPLFWEKCCDFLQRNFLERK